MLEGGETRDLKVKECLRGGAGKGPTPGDLAQCKFEEAQAAGRAVKEPKAEVSLVMTGK